MRYLVAIAVLFALGARAQADVIYMPPNAQIIYPAGTKPVFKDTVEFSGLIKTPGGVINSSQLGTGSGLSSSVLTDSLNILRDSIARLKLDIQALQVANGEIITKMVSNNDTIKNADAGKVFIKTSPGNDTLIMSSITGANFTTEFFFNNASTGQIVIRGTLSNSINGVQGANKTIRSNGLGVAIKTGTNQFIISGNTE